ncbi:tetratricopeptide repeat protein [Candidatus Riflebacteria bacterium]
MKFFLPCILILSFVSAHPLVAMDFLDHFTFGSKLYQRREFKKAEQHLLKSIKLNPGFTKSYYWLGLLYRDTNKPKKAIYYLERGSLVETEKKKIKFSRPLEMTKTFNMEEKRDIEERLAKSRLHKIRGYQFLKSGKLKAALVELRKAYRLNRTYQKMALRLARLEFDMGNDFAGNKVLQEVLKLFPENIEILEEYVHSLYKQKNFSLALKTIEEVANPSPSILKLKKDIQNKLPKKRIGLGVILKREGNRVVVDIGLKSGLHKHDEFKRHFSVYDLEKIIIKSGSGKIEEKRLKKIGELLITRIDALFSEAIIVSEYDKKIEKNDIVNQ